VLVPHHCLIHPAHNATWGETARALILAIVAVYGRRFVALISRCEGIETRDVHKKAYTSVQAHFQMFVQMAPALVQFATSQSQEDALQAIEVRGGVEISLMYRKLW
jgi:hypothetical protein